MSSGRTCLGGVADTGDASALARAAGPRSLSGFHIRQLLIHMVPSFSAPVVARFAKRGRPMPFDSTPRHEIADIKLAARKARAEGRLICDNYHKFKDATFSEEIGGVVYVCGLGAWEEVSRKRWCDV